MIACELRVGNLVDVIIRSGSVHLPSGMPRKVFEITQNEVLAYLPGINPCNIVSRPTYSLSDLSGIELTEGWLERLGFEQIGEPPYLGKGEYNFGYPVLKLNQFNKMLKCNSKGNSSGNLFLDGLRIECKYVHQLQNLYFALTGEELKLKS